MARRWAPVALLLAALAAGCGPAGPGGAGPGGAGAPPSGPAGSVESDLAELESTLDAVEADLAGD